MIGRSQIEIGAFGVYSLFDLQASSPLLVLALRLDLIQQRIEQQRSKECHQAAIDACRRVDTRAWNALL